MLARCSHCAVESLLAFLQQRSLLHRRPRSAAPPAGTPVGHSCAAKSTATTSKALVCSVVPSPRLALTGQMIRRGIGLLYLAVPGISTEVPPREVPSSETASCA